MIFSRRHLKMYYPFLFILLLFIFTFYQTTEASEFSDFDPQTINNNELVGVTGPIRCVGGFANQYPCNNVDLLSFMSRAELKSNSALNDIWGWTDPQTGHEYALVGLTNGTAFVDITNPTEPILIGNLYGSTSTWRDIKVYQDHAFVVSEASSYGMQIFDLNRLRNATTLPATFTEDAHYFLFGSAHNIVINEESGFAYGVGTSNCNGGLHIVDIRNPKVPQFAGCFSSDGYTHDAQCVIYHGPDTIYTGKEICFAFNEDTLTIVNVTDKSKPTMISRTNYNSSRYTHQGWITENQSYLLMNDELDEQNNGNNTRTLIWNIQALNLPVHIGDYLGPVASIDHNTYIKGNYAYEANYSSGLRILDIKNIASATLTEVRYFDTYPNNNSASFNGAWSNYPFFDSGLVIISGIDEGLFVVEPHISPSYKLSTESQTSYEWCDTGSALFDLRTRSYNGSDKTVEFTPTIPPANLSLTYAQPTMPVSSTNQLTVTISSPGLYEFDLIGTDRLNNQSLSWSFSVLTSNPTEPTLMAPLNLATNEPITPLLSWSGSPEATSYLLELATTPAFTETVYTETTAVTSLQSPALMLGTTYYWRVRSINQCGEGNITPTYQFETVPPPIEPTYHFYYIPFFAEGQN